jgi:hypothetical protein
MQMNFRFAAFLALPGALAAALALAPAAHAAEPSARALVNGKAIYKSANCVGCHKWHGGGGGGYGGAAFSLRTTVLDRDNFLLVVCCGRPGTGMPYHQTAAWDDGRCYGITRADLPPDRELRKGIELTDREMEYVTDYVLARQKGRGEPTFQECMEYWGPGSEKVCQSLD